MTASPGSNNTVKNVAVYFGAGGGVSIWSFLCTRVLVARRFGERVARKENRFNHFYSLSVIVRGGDDVGPGGV